MGIALIKIKIMPISPDASLKEIQDLAKSVIEDEKGANIRFETEAIAFGLNAIITTLSREETESTDELIEKLQNLENVSSAEIIDFRRALG